MSRLLTLVLILLLSGCTMGPSERDRPPGPLLSPGLHMRVITFTTSTPMVPPEARPPARETITYALHIPEGSPPRGGWPVILFLHGSGERGSDGVKQTTVGIYPAVKAHPERWPAVIVMPQLPLEDPDPQAFFTRWRQRTDLALAALDDALAATTQANPRRVALTGLSNGGQGAWQLAALWPTRFTRVMPIAASSIVPVIGPDGQPAPMLLNGKPLLAPTPTAEEQRRWVEALSRQEIWAIHGTADPVVPVSHMHTMLAAIEAMRESAKVRTVPVPRVTELQGVDHNSWDPTYGNLEIAAWLVER